MCVVSENDEGFEVTMTATEMTEGELDQDGMAQIQVLVFTQNHMLFKHI